MRLSRSVFEVVGGDSEETGGKAVYGDRCYEAGCVVYEAGEVADRHE